MRPSPRLRWGVALGALALALLAGVAFRARPRAPQGNPLLTLGPEARERLELTGRIVERLPAGHYTYVRVVDDAGVARWVVTLGRAPEVSREVRVVTVAHARDFDSARLQRRFDDLHFGSVRALAPDL